MADDLEEDDEKGEIMGFDDPNDSDVTDTDDGGAIVKLDDSPKRGDSTFYENLCDNLSYPELNRLATDLVELIGRDKEARAKRDKQYEEGIRRTGMGDDAPGGASFEGASKVVHPLLTEVCVDFSSRVIKELCPPDGPVKSKIVGDMTKDRVAKAARKSDFMNWQLTVQAPNFRAEMEQLFTQVPLGGAQYLKVSWNEKRNRPGFLFIPIDDMFLPYAATNFYTSQRKTHRQYLTKLEYQQRVTDGMYCDVDVITPSMVPDPSKAAQANDKIEGRDSNAYNEDGLREIYEVYVTMELDGDDLADGPAPYIVSIDTTSTKTLSIYRNWDEDDHTQETLEWIVEFPFVPWRGAYPIGIIHMIGGLSAAATGSLRALMDSAHIANSTGMLKLKGGTRGGQSLTMEPTEIKEIEGGLNVDDIRKLAMPLPFNPPSPTLFQLLGFVVDAAKGVVQTTMEDVSDSNTEMPVGTAMARIEQGQVVFSAIHARLHNAMQRMLTILNRLNGMYLDDKEETQEAGSLLASRSDFNGPMDVVPVSDPNIFSEAQRFAQVQAVAQRAQLKPELYNARNVEELVLTTLKIPSGKNLLNPSVTPEEENAVAENVKATLGRPIVAFPQQDHVAHLKTHLAYMMSPALGSSQLLAPSVLPVLIPHIKEHIALWYAAEVMATGSDVTDESLSDLIEHAKSAEDKKALDQMVAEASLDVVASAPTAFGNMPAAIGQAIALMQKVMPQPPMDPAVKVAADDVAMRGAANQEKNQLDQAKLADADKERAFELERDKLKEEHADERAILSATALMESKGVDSATAKQDALLEFAAGVHEVQTQAQVAMHGAVTDAAAQQGVAQTGADADKAVAQTQAAAQPPPGGSQ